MSRITLSNISKSFGRVTVIHNVNIDIADGEFVVFVGPSGCGKSTLLRLIAGLEKISEGQLLIDNRVVNDLTPKERRIAMVFQSYALYPHMTVYENMAFGLKIGRKNRAEVQKRVNTAAETLQLEKYLKRRPAELSGGQRQRVAIGRAIVRKPDVFLFDEPLSNLDAALRVKTRLEIAKLHEKLKTTIVYVTHDQVEAMTLADKIVVLREGRVEQIGTPLELYHEPANVFVAGFIGSPRMNLIAAKVTSTKNNHIVLNLPDNSTINLQRENHSCKTGDLLTVGIRPEHLITTNKGEQLQLTISVYASEHLGDISYLYGRLTDKTDIVVSGAGTIVCKADEKIFLTAEQQHIHLFSKEGRI